MAAQNLPGPTKVTLKDALPGGATHPVACPTSNLQPGSTRRPGSRRSLSGAKMGNDRSSRTHNCFGVKASLKIAAKHPTANIGFWCGPRSRLTVVDIDTQDESELKWSLDTFGESPIVVRTGSGKHHIYYRHDGEPRRIRPFPGREIDLLGSNGYCVAPPSVRPGGEAYRFIQATSPICRRFRRSAGVCWMNLLLGGLLPVRWDWPHQRVSQLRQRASQKANATIRCLPSRASRRCRRRHCRCWSPIF